MKITIERSALLKALNHVQSVVERRNTIPILSNLLIQADNGRLTFAATDLDIEIVETVEAGIAASGGTTASAHTLYDIVRKLPEGSQVEIDGTQAEGRLTLSAGRSRFALQCLPREDFPVMSAGDLPYRFTLPAHEILRLIDKTRFAISTEETRYYLNGIFLHVAEEKTGSVLRAVATDGHRLARVDVPLPAGAQGMPGVIVPRKTVGELHRLLEDRNEEIGIAVSDSKIRFEIGAVVLTSKLIDGTFPDYERVIPAGNNKVMEVDGKLFAEAVDRVSTISAEKTRAVKLSLENNRINLSVTNPDSGSATEEIEMSYNAEPLEIGFNARYILDITDQLDGERAVFVLADAGAPTLVHDRDDPAALYVLMPMRV
jgi:DNA polymerase-3 subunit beta